MSIASIAISSACTGRGDSADVRPAGASPRPVTAAAMRCASCRVAAGDGAPRPVLDGQLDPVGAQVDPQVTVGVGPPAATAAAATSLACASDRTGTETASSPSRYRQPMPATAAEAAVRDSGASRSGSLTRSRCQRTPGIGRPFRTPGAAYVSYLVGVVMWVRPVGRVQRVTPGASCSTCQSGACLARWCVRHLGARLAWLVGPSG